jgi:hypothetical protein
MASKRRIRRLQCGGKIRYETQDQAYGGLRKHTLMRKETWPMSPYRCRFCRGWHIGHTPKFVLQAMRSKRRRTHLMRALE